MSYALFADRQKWEAKVIAKVWSDPDFKARLKNNPEETLKQFLQEEGISFSGDLPMPRITILEESRDEGFLVIPQNFDDVELTAAELDYIAGGSAGCCCSGCMCGCGK